MSLEALYALFVAAYPSDKLSLAVFKRLSPWNVKKAYARDILVQEVRACKVACGRARHCSQTV
eukprot:2128366-Pleurochrysis_carterae.AAC.1